MELLVSFLVGGIVGLLLGTIFEGPLGSARRYLVQWFRAITCRPQLTVYKPKTFSLGALSTSWLVVDGDGEMAYTPETIECRVECTRAPLPPEITMLRKAIERREKDKERKGLQAQWNGPLYALDRYAISRTIPDENLKVVFTLRPTDYFTFQATVMSLDYRLTKPPAILTIRQKYLHSHDFHQPIPFLANGFGVALAIITGDNKLILSRRQSTTGARGSETDVSIVEGVHPIHDRSGSDGVPDLYHTAIRGAEEELGIALAQQEVIFLGFGVDIEYYQWNVLGMARISQTAEQVLEERERGAGGKWETRKFEVIDFNPVTVLNYLKYGAIWSTGLVTIYWALVHEFKREKVDSVAREVFGSQLKELV